MPFREKSPETSIEFSDDGASPPVSPLHLEGPIRSPWMHRIADDANAISVEDVGHVGRSGQVWRPPGAPSVLSVLLYLAARPLPVASSPP